MKNRLLLYPKSVNAPRFIIGHHIVCIVGWYAADIDGTMRWVDINSEILLVECNTWLLTARRHFHGIWLDQILEGLFYVTWILIRNVFYPIKFFIMCRRYIKFSQEKGVYFNHALFLVLLLGSLVYLNTKWSYDLFTKSSKNTSKIKLSS